MDTHSGGDIVVVEEFSPVAPAAPQGGQVPDLTVPPGTKSGAPPKSTRFAVPVSAPPSSNTATGAAADSAGEALKKRPSSYGRSVVRTASSVVKQVPRELRRLASFHRRRGGGGVGPRAFDRSTTAAAHALDGLRFINGAAGGWDAVEERFDKLTAHQDGVLYRSQFGQCIGMKKMEEQKKDGDSKTKGDQKGNRDGQEMGLCCFFVNRQEMGPERVVNLDENQHSSAAVAASKKPNKPDFAGELFDALNRRRNKSSGDGISKEEMREFWDQISDTRFDGRLQTFFDMVDKNADGRISEEEIKEIIMLSASENKLSLIREKAEEYARLIMETFDPKNLGYIELHNLESLLLQQAPILGTTTSRRNLSKLRSQKPDLAPAPEPNPLRRWLRGARYFLEDNWQRVWVLLLWLSACAALFAWKFAQYRRRHDTFEVFGYCVCAAKGAAETLKLNMALVLLPVSRNALTWLRTRLSAAAAAVPLADNLNFHMVIAAGIAAGAALHITSHLACDFPRLLHATNAEYQPLAQYFGVPRPDSYWWFVRGTEGWTGLAMVALMAAAFTLATPPFRRGKLRLPWPVKRLAGFEAFWYSHHCFVAVYALLLVHGHFLYLTREWYKKTTWMYLAAPMAVYAGERLTRAVRSRIRPVEVVGAEVYPGEEVLSLRFSTGKHEFRYKSGQYVFINCTDVSPFQWHPFSITSAPQDDYVSVHIRDAGDWTHKLKEIFSEANKGHNGQLPAECDRDGATTNPRWPKVRIDGPYGAPAQDYKQYDVVLLVGMGIGATPMISIIKDIVNNVKHLDPDDVEAGSGSAAMSSSSSSSFRTRRAYFYWVTREQRTFEWFHKVMDEVVEADRNSVVELHNHCTNVYEEGDARSALISMLQSLNRAKTDVDVVSGTRVRTHFARPDWCKVYKRIARNHSDQRVGVFYCGTPVLTKELRKLAQDYSRNTSTKFEFHKEIF